MGREREIATCLDEIDSAYNRIASGPLTMMQISAMKSWVREQKKKLKEMDYLIPVRRQPKARVKPDEPIEQDE